MAAKGQALKGALATMPRQAPLRGDARRAAQAATQSAEQIQPTGQPQQILHGQARRDYQAAAQAAQAAGEAPPSQQQYMPKIQPRSMVNAVSGQRNLGRPVGQGLAGAVGSGVPVGNQIGMLQPGQSPADVAGAVADGIAAQPQQGAWWQQQQQFGPPPGSLPMTKPGMPPMPQMPQPSANHGGQYRLSPGVYGSRDQAMEQYNQQMYMSQPAATQQGAPNSGPGSFPMQQRAREVNFAENRFNADKNNNLFRGNPLRRFKF